MEAKEKKDAWYRPVLDVFFDPNLKIPANGFLILFSAPMTAPSNRNYGGVLRTSNRDPNEIWQDQIKLLESYETFTAAYQTSGAQKALGNTLKVRVQDFSDKLKTDTMLESEISYLNKVTNYKASQYINLYLCADVEKQKEIFDRISKLYGKQLAVLYDGCDIELKNQFNKTKAFLQEQIPDYTISDNIDPSCEQWGQYLSVLLIWYAVYNIKKNDSAEALLYRLLDINPKESCATQMTISLQNVTMPMEHFISICFAAMRTELEFDELTGIYYMLKRIRDQMGGQLTPEIHELVTAFAKSADSVSKRKAMEFTESCIMSLAEEATKAKSMCTTCQSWIE